MSTAADSAPALWLVVATGAASGLLASIVGYALLGLPLVKLKVRHDLHLHISTEEAEIDSYVLVTNVRGRPVKIHRVMILQGRRLAHPRDWKFEMELSEGQSVKFTFDRSEFPNARGVAIDSAGRVWPRRRTLRVRARALGGYGVSLLWTRNGPTERQIQRVKRRARQDSQ